MKQKLLLLLLLLAAWGARAQAPAWQSALSSAAVDVRDVATTTNGDVFVTGSFTGSVTFGPNTLTSTGGQDMFVAKWPAGASTWAWGASGGGGATGAYDGSPTDNNDLGNALVVSGNRVYVTGQYHAATFSSGSGILTNTGGWDMFLAKFTDNTTSVAASGLLGSSAGAAQEYAYGVAVNPTTGNVYVTGYFGNNTYPGATIGGAALTSGGSADTYVAKYFDNGTTLSNAGAIGVGGASGEVATCLALNGNTIYVGGRFGSNASPFGTTAGANDLFVARFTDSNPTATGNLTYNNALRGGGDQTDGAQGIAVSGSSVYVTGYSSSTAAIAGSSLTNGGGYDIFVAKYTDNGSALVNGYAVRDGGAGDEDSADGSIGADIAVSGSSVYVTSNYNTAATIAGTTLTSAGGNASALNPTRFELVFSPRQALATVPAALAQQVAAYPNPAKSTASVAIELPAGLSKTATTADLLDVLGRVVYTQLLPATLATHSLPLTNLTTGVYSIRLTTSVGVVVKKLVVE